MLASQLLHELHSPLSKATIVHCDNVSVVYLAINTVQHQRTKHIEIDIHFICDKVAIGHIRLLHFPSSLQYTDIFTKGLPTSLISDFRSSLSVCCRLPAQTMGVYQCIQCIMYLACMLSPLQPIVFVYIMINEIIIIHGKQYQTVVSL